MKKILSLMIVIMLSFSIATAQAAQKSTIATLDDFELQFNICSIINGTNHSITTRNLKFSSGAINDVFQVMYGEYAFLQISVPHGTDNIIGILAYYMPDGSSAHAADYVSLIAEAMYAADVISSLDEVDSILEKLKFYDNLKDGASNSIEKNGLKIGYSVSASIGIFFYIELPDNTTASSTTDHGRIRINSGNNPNVRSEPSADSEKVGVAKSDQVYELLDESNNWYKIRLENGQTGWISGGMAQKIK